MNKFFKIFASTQEDKNVKNYVLYADSSNDLWVDSKKTVKATADVVEMMFEKNVIVKTADAEFKPSKMTESSGTVTLVVVDNSGSQGAAAVVAFTSQTEA